MTQKKVYPIKPETTPLVQRLVAGSDVVIGNDIVTETTMSWGATPLHDTSYLKLVHLSRKGLAYSKFKIAETAFALSKQELSRLLHISDRTLERIHKEKKRLSTPQTERVLELSMLYEQGWDLFSDKSNFRTWLDRPSVPLSGKTPLSLLDTTYGIQSVRTLLGRMAHGIPL